MITYNYKEDGSWEQSEIPDICVECIVVELDYDNVDISPIGFEDKETAQKYIDNNDRKCILVSYVLFGRDVNLDWTLN